MRPVTILIGKNNAGKSSVIKFLLMLKQTLESQAESFFVTDGRDAQLGTWNDLRHTGTRGRSSSERQFRFSVEVETEDLPSGNIREMWNVVSRTRAVSTEGGRVRVHLEFLEQPVQRAALTGRFVISGDALYGRELRTGKHEVRGFIGERQFFRQATNNLRTAGFLRFAKSTDILNKRFEAMAAEPFLEALRHEFLSQRHLSPVREESEQAVQIGSPPPGYVGHRGEYAMPHLVRIFTAPETKDEKGHVDMIVRFAAKVAGVSELKFRSEIARVLTDVRGRNIDTAALCSLADFGFGVSQCLPIFVQGVMHHRRQLLIVEQPEAQLHPTAQLELGSYFSELWVRRRVPSLIETHSGNLLLRLRRLVKQGVLPSDDVSVAYFTVEKVKRDRGGSFPAVVVKNLDVNSDGTLSKGLPMEFFGADVLEALEMGGGGEQESNHN
jgi:hypothetical protein